MMNTAPGTAYAHCPPREELIAFHRGELPENELERIAAHVTGCGACTTAVTMLSEGDMLRVLRGRSGAPASSEPECALLEARAQAIELRGTGPPTVPYQGAPSGEGDEQMMLGAIGSYELLEKLGRGGMGIVYKARQVPLNRVVALKVLFPDADEEAMTRFLVEGEAVARLKHPGVVRIFELGEHDGRLFYSMEYFERGTLAGRLAAERLTERQAAEIIAELARALHAVHEAEVIHRDLKPSNVLIADDGSLRLADFGLAKLLDEASVTQTHSHAVIGTAAYMAPEQAAGQSSEVGPAADVYSLGAILYECLTGRPPFQEKNRERLLEAVRTKEPTPPSEVRRGVSLDLEAICLKCLEKDRARRYQSALALAENLERWLRGEPIDVRPRGWVWRCRHAVRRHPRRTAAVALVVLTLTLVPAALYLGHQDRPEWTIERQLELGEEVTVVGAAGMPAWSDIIVGKKNAVVTTRPDGSFTLSSFKQALVELVRDTHQDCYELRAKVQNWEGQNGSRFGLYFLHGSDRTTTGTVHWLYQLAFNDAFSEQENFDKNIAPKVGPNSTAERPKGNSIFVLPCLCMEADNDDLRWTRYDTLTSQTFAPREGHKEQWRDLRVLVAPDKVRVFWEGEQVAEITADQLAEHARQLQAVLEREFGGGPTGPFVHFRPRMSLGLYVHKGSASFRDVVVAPRNAAP
jgi:serine/threonine-protein kinase